MEWDACWLPAGDVPETLTTPPQIASWELRQQGAECALTVEKSMGDAYEIVDTSGKYRIRGGETGVLYGTYRLLVSRRAGLPLPKGVRAPALPLRMLDHWDNLDGTVECGYAGASLFFQNGAVTADRARLRAYARLLASVSVNAVCLNNVRVRPAAHALLTPRLLPALGELAALFGAFGIRLMIAVDPGMPRACGLPTADPADGRVRAWWRERAALTYRYVPSLLGFLAQAASDGGPGPDARYCVREANMLARALQPHGGTLVWRCRACGGGQARRGVGTGALAAACARCVGPAGRLDGNAMMQIRRGPLDFQVREPVSPLLAGPPRAAAALELQLTQAHTGRQTALYAMQGMWNEVTADLPQGAIRAIAAVANTGAGACWTGHPFAQLNLFAYGLTAWQPGSSFELVTRLWARLTHALRGAPLQTLTDMLLLSREIYEKYAAPLGLCHAEGARGPCEPGFAGYDGAGRDAVGVDRTKTGTGLLALYPPALRARYRDPAACPERLLLFFHRLPYTYRMRDGRTLIQRLYDDHREGAQEAGLLAEKLQTLRLALPEATYRAAQERMALQLAGARKRRDAACEYFFRLSGIRDEKNRQ